jgi:outer membrane autotransporter protein
VHGGVYAFANAGPVVLSAMVDQAHSSYHVYRQTGVGHGIADPDGNTTAAALQAAWPLTAAQWQITPAVGALYQHQSLGAFGETVPSTSPLAYAFAVQGSHSTYNTMQPYAKVSFTHAFVAQGVSYVPQFEVGYRYDTRSGNAPVVQETAQDGTVFAMPGDNLGRGMATVGARITAQAGKSWNLYLDYQGQFSGRLSDNALSVGFTKEF